MNKIINKTKLVLRVAKRGLNHTIRNKGRITIYGNSPIALAKISISHIKKYGIKDTALRLKQNLVKLDRIRANNLLFSNGMMAGITSEQINSWYRHHEKKVTAVVCSYNDADILPRCIESLLTTTTENELDIIIVDDYCQESSRSFLKQYESEPRIKVVYRKQNGGYTKAANTGIKEALKLNPNTDVVMINNDIEAKQGWLKALCFGAYGYGKNPEKIGIVGAKLLYPDGTIQHAGAHRNSDPDFKFEFDHYYRFRPSDYGPANVPEFYMAVTGACFFIKNTTLKTLGLFDEEYGFAHDDADYCLRAWDQNIRTLYFPSAELIHHEGLSRGKNPKIEALQKQSLVHFEKKWGSFLDDRNVKDEQGRIRVIYVFQTLGHSGGIRIGFEQANKLNPKKFAAEIWGLDAHDCPWKTEPHVKLKKFEDYDQMREALEKEQAIKVGTWWETLNPVWLASIKNGIPACSLQEFETWFYDEDDIMARSTVVANYKREFRYFTTASYQRDELEQATNINIRPERIIPCGYDHELYKPLKGETRKDDAVLALGRKFFQKNFDFIFKGWEKSLAKLKSKMWLFGYDADALARLNPDVKSFGAPSNEEVNKLYNQATVLIQASLHEGFCLPALEAMAAGCPLICTDMHGNRDFCHDGKNCLIIEQNNQAALSQAILRLMKDKKLQHKLREGGLKTAKNYTWDAIIPKLEKFYQDVESSFIKQ
jgi:GT2 family glycosyltransferase